MKKLLFILLCLPLIFSSCKKEEEPTNNTNLPSILGSWKSFEWKILYNSGYWTSFPNGQKVTTYNSSQIENFWLDLMFLSDGTVMGIDEDGFTMPGSWIKNGNSLIIDENSFTISTLSTSFLTVHSTEDDTSTNYWDPINDTIYFTERTDTIKWERTN